MCRHLVLSVMLSILFLSGCGPVSPQPAVVRVSPEHQEKIDHAWSCMTSKPDVDRLLLLDCIIVRQLHHLGVDSLEMTVRKRLDAGEVEMILRFDRDDPEIDEFVVNVFDVRGRPVRREYYAGDEVRERAEFLLAVQFNHRPGGGGDAAEATLHRSADDADANEALDAERRARMEEIALLTGPPASEIDPAE